ncbi:hypothetical protein J6S88_02025 [bacterium]|nr:hypothetical protein [bacterium]
MPIQGFDYKGFAQSMFSQAQELVPPYIDAQGKEYICSTLLKFANIAGEALDNSGEFNADQAMFITQVIAEWTFHKSVDLVNSGIPRQYWDPTMQKIAMVIFEIAQNAQRQNVPAEHALAAIEQQVRKVYTECMEELKNKNLIDEGLLEKAVSQSNIDAMAQSAAENQAQEEEIAPEAEVPEEAPEEFEEPEPVQEQVPQNPPPQQARPPQNQGAPDIPQRQRGYAGLDDENSKKLKLLTVAMLFQRMQQDKVQVILDKFEPGEAGDIIRYMGMKDLSTKLDARTVMQCLRDFKDFLPVHELENSPTKIVNKIKEICADVDREKLEKLLKPERALVRRFVFSALEDEIVPIPPKVACILASYIENGV